MKHTRCLQIENERALTKAEIFDLKEELKKAEEKREEIDEWGNEETESSKIEELLAENASLRLKITALEKEVVSVEFNS